MKLRRKGLQLRLYTSKKHYLKITNIALLLVILLLSIFLIKNLLVEGSYRAINIKEKVFVETPIEKEEENTGTSEVFKEVEEIVDVPQKEDIKCSTSQIKTYMSYKAVTATRSKQWDLIHNYMTVSEDGMLRSSDGYIGVALGSHYGPLGSKFEIHLDTGIVFKAIKIDEKADRHVNNGCVHKSDGSMIEFVIDTSKFTLSSNGYVWSGNFNNNPAYRGKVVAIYSMN